MLTKTQAIVLRSSKYGESKLIIDMFTRQLGRQSFIISLPKTSHGKLKKQFFQPFTLLNIECDMRQQSQLQKLREVSMLLPLTTLLATPAKLSISLFLAEFLYHALRNEQENEQLFDYILTSIQWLDNKESDYANFHLVFLIHLSRFLGFYPNLEEKTENEQHYFDLRAATFCTIPPTHKEYLKEKESSLLRLMMRMDYPTMHLFQMSQKQRNRCLDIALQYYQIHLPDFPKLRSLSVLRALWG